MDQVVQIVSQQEDGKFSVNQDGIEFLQQLPKNYKLSVVAIVGKYRTGKSYLINKLFVNKPNAFQIGNTIKACTKGLWMYKDVISTQEKNKYIIVLDTEGLGAVDVNKQSDSKIFLFSLMLASQFIYNSVGTIDENSLSDLGLIINLAKTLQETQSTQLNFPSFLWILRDFTLQLQDKNGQSIDCRQYLENSLDMKDNKSDKNKNEIRDLIKKYFPMRDCQTLVRPVESEKSLQVLGDLQDYQLRKEFLEQLDLAKQKILDNLQIKKINDVKVNGALLADYCIQLCEIFNSDSIPDIRNTWNCVFENQALQIFQQIKKSIYKRVEDLQNTYDFSIQEQKYLILEESMQMISNIVGDEKLVGDYRKKVVQIIDQKFEILQDSRHEYQLKQVQKNFEKQIKQLEIEIKFFEKADIQQLQDKIDDLINQIYNQFNNIKIIQHLKIKFQDLLIKSIDDIYKNSFFKEISILQQKYDNLQDENQELKFQCFNDQKQIQEELQSEVLIKDKKIQTLQQKLDYDYEQMKELQANFEETIKQNEKLSQIMQQLQDQNQQFLKKQDKIQNQLFEGQMEIDCVVKQNNIFLQDYEKIQQQCQFQENQNFFLKQENTNLTNQNKMLNDSRKTNLEDQNVKKQLIEIQQQNSELIQDKLEADKKIEFQNQNNKTLENNLKQIQTIIEPFFDEQLVKEKQNQMNFNVDIVIITLQQMKNRLEILDKNIYENDKEITLKNRILENLQQELSIAKQNLNQYNSDQKQQQQLLVDQKQQLQLQEDQKQKSDLKQQLKLDLTQVNQSNNQQNINGSQIQMKNSKQQFSNRKLENQEQNLNNVQSSQLIQCQMNSPKNSDTILEITIQNVYQKESTIFFQILIIKQEQKIQITKSFQEVLIINRFLNQHFNIQPLIQFQQNLESLKQQFFMFIQSTVRNIPAFNSQEFKEFLNQKSGFNFVQPIPVQRSSFIFSPKGVQPQVKGFKTVHKM